MKKQEINAASETDFFENSTGQRQYNGLCLACKRDCKQSYRADIVRCGKYTGTDGDDYGES